MMTKYLAIVGATVREGFARKTILGFFAVSTLLIVLMLLVCMFNGSTLQSLATDHVKNGRRGPDPSIAGLTLLEFVWMIISYVLIFIVVLVGLFVTSSFVTSIMEKGTIDLLLSKPVPRWWYLTGRYLGGVGIIFVEVLYLVLGLWLAAGLTLGIWSSAFPTAALFITLIFAGVYAVATLVGVVSRSSWLAVILVIVTYIVMFLLLPIGRWLDTALNGEPGKFFTTSTKVLRYTLPGSGVGDQMVNALTHNTVDFGPLLLTTGLTLAYLAISTWVFSKKEF